MAPNTKPIHWIKAARRDFEDFPDGAQTICLRELTFAAGGAKGDNSKPMQGMGSGVLEIALAYKGDAFRVVYAVQLEDAVWVIHAFKKKSTQGIKTPQREIELIRNRLKQLKGILR